MTFALPTFSLGTIASSVSLQSDDLTRESRVRSACLASDMRAALRSKLADLMVECAHEGWDGYGASPATEEARDAAFRFIAALPDGFMMPDISADPDGCFTFEWHRSPRRAVLVSVHPDYHVDFSALIGSSRAFGDAPIFDELPRRLVSQIEELYAH